MPALNDESLIRQLNWRYAVKKFDSTKKISVGNWKTLEQALVLTPSSFGLQPWKFVVVNDPSVRAKLRAAAYNQSQLTDASHVVVITYKKDLSPADVDHFISRIAEVRGAPVASLEGYKGAIMGSIGRPKDQVDNWAARQAYIAIGNVLNAAAMLEIDACPMEGFEPAKFDEILGLEKLGLKSVAIVALGYRAADDGYASAPKVRFPHEEVILQIG